MQYRIGSAPLIHTPGMFSNILRRGGFGDSLNKETRGTAGRLFYLASMCPTVPAGVLLAVAEGSLTYTVEGDTVVIDDGKTDMPETGAPETPEVPHKLVALIPKIQQMVLAETHDNPTAILLALRDSHDMLREVLQLLRATP